MSEPTRYDRRIHLIALLWGLLLTKCFLLEFLVRRYEVPVNSLTYIWSLSVLMAAVATFVHAGLQKEELNRRVRRTGFTVAAVATAVASVFVLAALTAPPEGNGTALATAALMLAVKSIWIRARRAGTSPRWKALGWMFVAFTITYAGSPVGFFVFALGIVSIVVVPGLALSIADRKRNNAGAIKFEANS